MRYSRLSVFAVAAALAVATMCAGAASASSTPRHFRWAPAATAAVHPGMQTYTGSDQCTANFVFSAGSTVYLGQAAHCAGIDGNTAVDGCTSHSMPLGTEVQDIDGNRIGELAYSSWLMMQSVSEQDQNLCSYNDFALIRLDPDVVNLTNPSVPLYGGPTALRESGFTIGSQIFSYGNSGLRAGLLPGHRGLVTSELAGGLSHQVYMVGPGIPGDSGSGLLDSTGRAAGILSTIQITPLPLANNYADLARAMSYAAQHGTSVSLVPGDVAFHHDLPSTLV